ncbi:SLC13 family permease [Saccharicrinis sp. FJH54]|uniref:SLC13 family permease n=1 Tax=Saccharicrinis sp. FJH54 TaxID=3344665 RepID=UPI0035D4937A
MTFDAYLVSAIIILMVIALFKEMFRPGLILFSGLFLFMALGIIDVQEALAGFSNKGMITIAILFLVSEGIRQTGALNYLAKVMLPKKALPVPILYLKTLIPVSALSAFLNNTPVVIIFAPIFKKWAEKVNLPASKFLIPLSYATILGGVCTLFGTSTNLVVHGLMLDAGFKGFGIFELGKVGGLIALAGFIYMVIFGNWLLPGKKVPKTYSFTNFREYYFDVVIKPGSPLIGEMIEKRKNLKFKDFLVSSIHRNGQIIKTTRGRYIIEEGDHLILAGKSEAIEMLLEIDGLEMACLQKVGDSFRKQNLKQIEAVISPRFPGIGRKIGDFDFLSHYGGIVMAVHRNGERISSNVDELILKEGDNLILLATEKFLNDWGDSRVFYTTSYLGDVSKPEKKDKMWLSLIIIIGMVAGTTSFQHYKLFDKIPLDMFFFAAMATVLMVWTRILPAQKYTKAISWDVIITIACAFGVSKALNNSGAADVVATFTINIFKRYGPYGVIAGIYLITMLFTEVITNNAAAALSFPIAYAAAQQLGVDPKPFFVAIAMAASASFSTPIGYQTNLIVQSIGNYRFSDYLRIGLPLNFISMAISVIFIPYFWEF